MCRSHSIHEQDALMTQYAREERAQMHEGNWGEGRGTQLMHQFEKVEKTTSLCKFDNSLVWKTRRQLCESRGGRPGLPVPNSPKGLCGRKATLNELLSRAYDGDSAQRSCKLHCSSAMTISVGLALSCGRVRLRDFWGCTSGGVNDEVNATCIYSPALRVSVGNSGLCCCTAVFV